MMIVTLAVAPVVLTTLAIGLLGVAAMRTTSDFLVASRRVSPLLNSAAVSGEYLSAASFLGVAGLMVRDGVGALWYPVGFTAGYIAMLALVAAPMRRSGALTVPDFAEARLGSVTLRRLAAVVVLVISVLYLVPQFRTAGLVLSVVSGTPYWVGVILSGLAVSITLALGGMRAATYVQAFQFVLKLVLFIVPAAWLVAQVGPEVRQEALHPVEFTHFEAQTPVSFRISATLEVPEGVRVVDDDGGVSEIPPGEWHVPAGATVVFAQGSAAPVLEGSTAPGGPGWERPLLDLGTPEHPLLATWAVLLATMLGTMGLPHVIMRFHTRFTGLLTAGAFAAFLATSLGLLLVVAGAISHDLVPGGLRQLRMTVVGAAIVVLLLALPAVSFDASTLVTWGFTVAASTFCPLLVLGIWWSRLTAGGAIAGVTVGLLASCGGFALGIADPPVPGWVSILLIQPAPWSVPLAFATMIVVSLFGRPQPWATAAMLRLHLHEHRRSPFADRSALARDLGHSSWSARRSSAVRRITRRLVR